jgi:hypothetical protein
MANAGKIGSLTVELDLEFPFRGYDDPETLSCEIKSTCPTGADVRQPTRLDYERLHPEFHDAIKEAKHH